MASTDIQPITPVSDPFYFSHIEMPKHSMFEASPYELVLNDFHFPRTKISLDTHEHSRFTQAYFSPYLSTNEASAPSRMTTHALMDDNRKNPQDEHTNCDLFHELMHLNHLLHEHSPPSSCTHLSSHAEPIEVLGTSHTPGTGSRASSPSPLNPTHLDTQDHTDSTASGKHLAQSKRRLNKRGRQLIIALSIVTLGLLPLYQWLCGKTWKLPSWCYEKTPTISVHTQQAAPSQAIAPKHLAAHAQPKPNASVIIVPSASQQASQRL